VFELPVILFFLTLIRVVSPKFLIAHSRYAILAIVIVAAIVTPTPDIFNLLLFAVPMCMLFYVGIFASYILVLKREGRRLPWNMILGIVALVLALVAGVLVLLIKVLHYHLIPAWPFLTR
jgi:sec-independent protein translocase protein TatC